MTITHNSVPTVSLAMADQDTEAFAEAIGRSFADWGFAIVSDHAIPPALIARAEAMSPAFFPLPGDDGEGRGQRLYPQI